MATQSTWGLISRVSSRTYRLRNYRPKNKKETKMSNLFVGNIPWKCSEQDIGDMFAQHAEVVSVKIILDRETGRSRGFGFLELANPADTDMVIGKMDGFDIQGRQLKVNKATPRN